MLNAHPVMLRSLYIALIRSSPGICGSYLCGIHTSVRMLTHWRLFRSLPQKSLAMLSGSLGDPSFSTLRNRTYLKQCHLYKIVHCLSILPNSPFTFSHSSYFCTHSNHSLSDCMSHSLTLMLIFYSFFVMPQVPGLPCL